MSIDVESELKCHTIIIPEVLLYMLSKNEKSSTFMAENVITADKCKKRIKY